MTHPRLEALRKLQQSVAARGVDLALWAREARDLRRGAFPSLGNRRMNAGDQHRKYWDALHAVLNTKGGPVSGNRKPQPDTWMDYAVGRSGFRLYAWRRKDGRISAGVYIGGEDAKAFFELLRRDQRSVERESGCPLHWREMPIEREIALYLRVVDPRDERDWPRQHEWLATRLNELHRVFSPRIKNLNLHDLARDEE